MNIGNTKQGIILREKVMNVIISYISERGYSPTVREIGKMAGIKSTSSVHAHLERLISEGRIKKESDAPRTIRIVEK